MKKKYGGVITNWQVHNLTFTKKQLEQVHPGKKTKPMVITGTITEDPTGRFEVGHHVRTSLVVKLDRKKGRVETLNTVYDLRGEEGKDVLPDLKNGVLQIFY